MASRMKPDSRPADNKIVVNALNPKHIDTELPKGMACDFDPSAVLLKQLVAHLATAHRMAQGNRPFGSYGRSRRFG
jgi:hypothetical protein